jgi:hypothetical protein
MTITLGKLAPTTLVILLGAYCAWSSFDSAGWPAQQAQPPSVAELPSTLLAPAMPAVPARNPFEPAVSRPVLREEKTSKPTPRDGPPQKDLRELLSGLALNGTCIRGDYRAAVINGQLYHPGQPLLSDSRSALGVVAEIEPHRVLIEGYGQVVELAYPSESDRALSSKPLGQSPRAVRPAAATASDRNGPEWPVDSESHSRPPQR